MLALPSRRPEMGTSASVQVASAAIGMPASGRIRDAPASPRQYPAAIETIVTTNTMSGTASVPPVAPGTPLFTCG